jgi:T5orf172 domain
MDKEEFSFYCVIEVEKDKEILLTMNDSEVTNHLLENLYLCFSDWQKMTLYYTDTGNFHCQIPNTERTNENRHLNYRRRKRYKVPYLKRNNYVTTNFFDTEIFQFLLPSEKLLCHETIQRNNSKALLEKWRSNTVSKPNKESFYILAFKNESFIKIGITSNLIEHRVFQYCFDDINIKFPSNVERNDKPFIDIHNSFIFETDNALLIENLIKKEFVDYKTEELREFFYINSQKRMLDYLENYKHLYSSKHILCKKIGFSDLSDFIYSQPTWSITKWANKYSFKVIKGNESCNCIATKNKAILENFYDECWQDYTYNMDNFYNQDWDYDYIELIIKLKEEIGNIDLANTSFCEAFLVKKSFLRNKINESFVEEEIKWDEEVPFLFDFKDENNFDSNKILEMNIKH